MTDLRPWVYAAIFGALWGSLESTLGTALKLTPGVPAGTMMAAVGIVCLVCARRLAPAAGATVVAGATAALVMTFSLGGMRPGSLVAVLLEATLVEVAMTVSGSRWPGAVAGGALALAITPLQKVVVLLLVSGPAAARAWAEAAIGAVEAMGAPAAAPAGVVAAAVGLAGAVGALAGAWSWRLAGRIGRRLGAPP